MRQSNLLPQRALEGLTGSATREGRTYRDAAVRARGVSSADVGYLPEIREPELSESLDRNVNEIMERVG